MTFFNFIMGQIRISPSQSILYQKIDSNICFRSVVAHIHMGERRGMEPYKDRARATQHRRC